MFHILFLLSFLHFSFLQAAWRDIAHRLAPLNHVQNVALIIPSLLHENDEVEGLDASLVEQVRNAFQNREYDRLETMLTDIDHPQSLLTLGLLHFTSEKGTEYLQAAATKYQSFEALLNLGVQAYAKQDIPQATYYLEEARKNDECGLSYFYLSMILQEQIPVTENGKSREYLEIAANTYHVPEALVVLGFITQPEDPSQDSPSWRQLIEMEDIYKNYKHYATLLYQIGVLHIQKRKKELGYEYLHKAADTYRLNDACHVLGSLYLSEKNYLKACSYFECYEPLNDTQREKRAVALTVAYVASQQYDKARPFAEYVTEHCVRV